MMNPDTHPLTRVRELLALAGDAASRHSFASRYDALLAADSKRRSMLTRGEVDLAALKEPGWTALKAEAAKRLTRLRDWTPLMDLLSEAKGYRFLENMGCVDITFLERSYMRKSPDFAARLDGRLVLCEVKTIWLSGKTRKPPRGDKRAKRSARPLDEFLTRKFTWTIQEAKAQLDAYDGPDSRRIVFVVIHYDKPDEDIDDCRVRITDFLTRTSFSGIEATATLI